MGWNYDTKEIDRMIMKYVPERKGLQKIVLDAMADAVEAGGKRIRPILMLETYRMFKKAAGGEVLENEVAPFMAALEMIHTFSLIHDDMPCMDGDTLRRGKPTTWVTYGEDIATLAGDGLSLEACAVMAHAAAESAAPEKAVRAMALLIDKSGYQGMLGGQTLDVAKTGQPLTEEELDFIYRLKTGALLEAAMMVGAILGGASEEEVLAVGRSALSMGIAFQIKDDILDETSTAEVLGKPIHSDEENHKTTWVSIYGMDRAEKDAEKLSLESIRILKELGMDSAVLEDIIGALLNRDR